MHTRQCCLGRQLISFFRLGQCATLSVAFSLFLTSFLQRLFAFNCGFEYTQLKVAVSNEIIIQYRGIPALIHKLTSDFWHPHGGETAGDFLFSSAHGEPRVRCLIRIRFGRCLFNKILTKSLRWSVLSSYSLIWRTLKVECKLYHRLFLIEWVLYRSVMS